MKRLSIFLVLLILTVGFVFAQTEQEQQIAVAQEEDGGRKRSIELFNLEVGIGFPVHWTNGRHTEDFYQVNQPTLSYTLEDKFITANAAFSLATVFNFTRIIGLAIEIDLFYGAKIAGFSNPSSDYNSLFGFNAFLGPVFYLVNNNTFRIPLSVGFHMYYFSDDLWVSDYYPAGSPSDGAWFNRKDMQFGPALAIGLQFHFNKGVYMFSKVQFSIDFIRIHKVNTDNLTDMAISERSHTDLVKNSINWGIRPSVGIGIKGKN